MVPDLRATLDDVKVLSSRVMLAPSDFEASRRFYEDVLGLEIYREYGHGGRVTGVVYFLGGGHLELNRAGPAPVGEALKLWLQVPDAAAAEATLRSAGATITDPAERKPWGLIELWATDPDGVTLVIVEVPADHPLRSRLD